VKTFLEVVHEMPMRHNARPRLTPPDPISGERWTSSGRLPFSLFFAVLLFMSDPSDARDPVVEAPGNTETAAATFTGDVALAGEWSGAIQLPTGQLEIQLLFEADAGSGWTGTIDIPLQGVDGLELREISQEGNRCRFSIAGIPGDPTFDGRLDGDRMHGQFTQGGAELTFELNRGGAPEPLRPQTPEGPFPYSLREVLYSNGSIEFSGTLTTPPGPGPHPAAVLLSGSGPQNRDGEVFGHRPFLVLADYLSRRGFAVLRSDDRGVGGSTGDLQSVNTHDLASDAVAAVRFLSGLYDIDAGRIGLIGHSEGGLVAPAAAQLGDGAIAFVVLLGAPGVPGSELLIRQNELILAVNGANETAAARQIELLRRSLEMTRAGAPESDRRAALRDLAMRQVEDLEPRQREALEGQLEGMIDQQIAVAMTPWFESFVRYDPAPALAALEVPVLSIHGGLDLQVDSDQNRPMIAAALTEHPDATVVELPQLNHLLQTANTGSPLEYSTLEETLAPEALDAIHRWLAERFPPTQDAAP